MAKHKLTWITRTCGATRQYSAVDSCALETFATIERWETGRYDAMIEDRSRAVSFKTLAAAKKYVAREYKK